MKFVTLALALLLAIGSHAATLPAEAPSALAHIRSVADMYILNVKESIKRALDTLDDPEYTDFKTIVAMRLDAIHAQFLEIRNSVAPVTDSVVTTLADATAELRDAIANDVRTLHEDLGPRRMILKDVLLRHIAEYREKMEPIVVEYHKRHTAEMDALRAKLEPVIPELKDMVSRNVEETKNALIPIVEAAYAKVAARMENLKGMVTPYIEEYKEQINTAIAQAKSMDPNEMTALREKITPMAEEVKTKLSEIFETIAAAINKPEE